ncbi:CGNR zinc finger domain-containing protein [Streptomyces sp. RFCAC02]|uniref:CGNR zinc finger domain-containing protein n=1 Tax=Streptomyces sp. RFCAC02 TaxID=2499143 RepID=UPI001021A213|nr:CGNR zinc finger domain-containing protein [Streptomyces sp. RFCAC02]
MVNNGEGPSQDAPGDLERVRELLNTWLVPNDTRRPTDLFDAYADRHGIPPDERAALRALRDDLRAAVEREPGAEERVTEWIGRLGVGVAVTGGALAFRHPGGPAAGTLGTVLEAVALGRWPRMKACPDCRWVFYDSTRNAGKRWCLMTAGGPDGRSCGSIAKVRRHRRKHATGTAP